MHYLIYHVEKLVSSVKDVKSVDSERPRHLTVIFEASTGTVESTIEFDTDESAHDWRRELLGASRPRGNAAQGLTVTK
jgi:hypothetical protein